jgi:hypothetical protein
MRASLARAPTAGAHLRRGRIFVKCAAACRATGPPNRNGCATARRVAPHAQRKSFSANRFGRIAAARYRRSARVAHSGPLVTFVTRRAKFVHPRAAAPGRDDRAQAARLRFHQFFE